MRFIRISKILQYVIDVVYPPRCPVCNTIQKTGYHGVCEECSLNLEFVEEPFCLKCGKSLRDDSKEYCSDCLSKRHYYDEGRAALVYDEYMSRSIYRFKYNNKQEYAQYYGKVIFERLGDKIESWNAQVLIPVPIHKSKMSKRGYNQATLIANQLSKLTNIPVNDRILIRKNQTKMQKNLSARERENNLKNAFIVRGNVVKLEAVIIVDDIYTTGSTVDAIARVLKDAGVSKVYYVSLCIGRGI